MAQGGAGASPHSSKRPASKQARERGREREREGERAARMQVEGLVLTGTLPCSADSSPNKGLRPMGVCLCFPRCAYTLASKQECWGSGLCRKCALGVPGVRAFLLPSVFDA